MIRKLWLWPLLTSLIRAGVLYGVSQVLLSGKETEHRLSKIMAGVVLMLVAVPVGFLGIATLVAAFFFYLSAVEQFVRPAFITGILVVLLAALLSVQGLRIIRR